MKKIGLIGISCFVILLNACNSQKQESSDNLKTEDSTQNVSIDNKVLEEQFVLFYNAFKNKDSKTLNKFIDPERGYLVIYSEGAMPQAASTNDLVSFVTYSGLELYEFVSFPDITLRMETLPKINCDSKSFYDKEGAFYSNENLFVNQKLWNYGDFNKDEKERFENSAKLLTHNILITGHGRYGVIFKDGKLIIAFMDFRKPCNA